MRYAAVTAVSEKKGRVLQMKRKKGGVALSFTPQLLLLSETTSIASTPFICFVLSPLQFSFLSPELARLDVLKVALLRNQSSASSHVVYVIHRIRPQPSFLPSYFCRFCLDSFQMSRNLKRGRRDPLFQLRSQSSYDWMIVKEKKTSLRIATATHCLTAFTSNKIPILSQKKFLFVQRSSFDSVQNSPESLY